MYVPIAHGVYYLLTGLWPVFNASTFQKVTGPKTDIWLVKTAGILFANIGLLFLLGQPGQLKLFAISVAVCIAAFEAYYSLRKVISKIYLLDAAVEIVLAAGWLLFI
jgi:hypothetical protein